MLMTTTFFQSLMIFSYSNMATFFSLLLYTNSIRKSTMTTKINTVTTQVNDNNRSDHFCDNKLCPHHLAMYNSTNQINIIDRSDQVISISRYEFINTAEDNSTRNFFCSICINVINTINEARHSLYKEKTNENK